MTTPENDPEIRSTPEFVRYLITSAIRIANKAFEASEIADWRRRIEFSEFTDGNNDEIGLLAVDPITAQRFEIRIREEG